MRSGGVGRLERVVERQARGSGLAGSHGSGAVGAGGGSSWSGAAGGAAAGGSGAPAGAAGGSAGVPAGAAGSATGGSGGQAAASAGGGSAGALSSAAGGSGSAAGGGHAAAGGGHAPGGGHWWGLIRLRRRGGRRRRRRVVVGRGLMRLVAVVRVVLVWVVLLVALVGVLVLVLVVVRVGWLGWFRRVLVLVLGVGCWLVLVVGGWRSCWRVRGCRCRRGCGRRFRRVVWIRGWCRCWGVRWRITRSWLGMESVVDPVHAQSVDIVSVDGEPVGPGNVAARDLVTEIAALDPSVRPSEIGTPWPIQSQGFFSGPGQQAGLHLGFVSQADYQAPAAAGGVGVAGVGGVADSAAVVQQGPVAATPAAQGAAQGAAQALNAQLAAANAPPVQPVVAPATPAEQLVGQGTPAAANAVTDAASMGAAVPGWSSSQQAVAGVLFKTFTSAGLSPAGASAIIGNWMQESSLNPSEPGGFLAQWGGSRLSELTPSTGPTRALPSRRSSPYRSSAADTRACWSSSRRPTIRTPRRWAVSTQYERPNAALANNANREAQAAAALAAFGTTQGPPQSAGVQDVKPGPGRHAGRIERGCRRLREPAAGRRAARPHRPGRRRQPEAGRADRCDRTEPCPRRIAQLVRGAAVRGAAAPGRADAGSQLLPGRADHAGSERGTDLGGGSADRPLRRVRHRDQWGGLRPNSKPTLAQATGHDNADIGDHANTPAGLWFRNFLNSLPAGGGDSSGASGAAAAADVTGAAGAGTAGAPVGTAGVVSSAAAGAPAASATPIPPAGAAGAPSPDVTGGPGQAGGALDTAAFKAVKPHEPHFHRHTVQFLAAVQPARTRRCSRNSPGPASPDRRPRSPARSRSAAGAGGRGLVGQQQPGQVAAAAEQQPPGQAVQVGQGQGAGIVAEVPGGGSTTVSSSLLTPGQAKFAGRLADLTGLDPRVVSAWELAEESGSAARGREAAGNFDWLNIGYTDSAKLGTGDSIWSDPIRAPRRPPGGSRGKTRSPATGPRAPASRRY